MWNQSKGSKIGNWSSKLICLYKGILYMHSNDVEIYLWKRKEVHDILSVFKKEAMRP